MKLRFRQNSLRLRVNRREVDQLAAGLALQEDVIFPGNSRISYILEPSANERAAATFKEGVIRVRAPQDSLDKWALGEEIGMYFDLPANGALLRVALEKDLECVDGPVEERDPDAFPRAKNQSC